MKCNECFGASFNDCERCKKMTGKEYQKLAMRTCSIPYDNNEGRLHLDLLQKQVKLQEFFRRYIRDMNLTKSISRKNLVTVFG